jgi:hypothetical protein
MATTTKPRAETKAVQRARFAAEISAGTLCPCEEHNVRPPTDFTAIMCSHKVCESPLQARGRFLHWGECGKCKTVYWDSGDSVVEIDPAMVDNLRRHS